MEVVHPLHFDSIDFGQAVLVGRGDVFGRLRRRHGDGAGALEVRFALKKENAEVYRQLTCGVWGWWCQESLRVCKGGEGLTAVAYGGCVSDGESEWDWVCVNISHPQPQP